jgi:hypothetical protein
MEIRLSLLVSILAGNSVFGDDIGQSSLFLVGWPLTLRGFEPLGPTHQRQQPCSESTRRVTCVAASI